MTSSEYFDELPKSIVEKLQAGAFQSLCTHLQERSDEVQNIDLMTISGFCRNCLAKWLVVEARTLADDLRCEHSNAGSNENGLQELDSTLSFLDALGYDEAAQYVYGMNYPEWKKRHSKKASDETMQKYNDSKSLWAPHDKDLLAKRIESPPVKHGVTPNNIDPSKKTDQESSKGPAKSLLSNVCCQDEEAKVVNSQKATKHKTRELPPYKPPSLPEIQFSLGILTVSDRASSGEYATGDLSGPAVKTAVDDMITTSPNTVLKSVKNAVVPDNMNAIQNKLKEWADSSEVQLIITTGGTGFSSRDVTPEATNLVSDRICDGLITFCTMECAKIQPLASLSRGSAGVRGNTLIVNLPGNPKGVSEIIPILLPLALYAVKDLC